VSNSDRITNLDNSTPSKTLQFLVTGTVSGATVTIYAGGTAIGSTVASGQWCPGYFLKTHLAPLV
jgi:hypothetical protein